MLVLLTRPRQQSLATARTLRALGYRCLLDPMLVIRQVGFPPPGAEDVAAVLLTSANAAMAMNEALLHRPVFAVGRATAVAARNRGAEDVREAAGDGAALAELVGKSLAPAAGRLLHLAGEEVREGMAEPLIAAGYRYEKIVVYRAEPASRLSPRTVSAFKDRELDAVLLFSPRTAAIFRSLVEAADLGANLGATAAVCLSEAVAEPIRGLGWREVLVAAERDQKALVACLEAIERRW